MADDERSWTVVTNTKSKSRTNSAPSRTPSRPVSASNSRPSTSQKSVNVSDSQTRQVTKKASVKNSQLRVEGQGDDDKGKLQIKSLDKLHKVSNKELTQVLEHPNDAEQQKKVNTQGPSSVTGGSKKSTISLVPEGSDNQKKPDIRTDKSSQRKPPSKPQNVKNKETGNVTGSSGDQRKSDIQTNKSFPRKTFDRLPPSTANREIRTVPGSSSSGVEKRTPTVQILKRGAGVAPNKVFNSNKDTFNKNNNRGQGVFGTSVPKNSTTNKNPDLKLQSNSSRDVSNTSKSFPVKPNTAPVTNCMSVQSQSLPVTAASSSSSAVVADGETSQKKKRKKQPTKEVRRKKREEKYYQELYKNKDSHIKFISADLIRKLQNDKDSTSKSNPPNRFQNPLYAARSVVSAQASSQDRGNSEDNNNTRPQSAADFPTLDASKAKTNNNVAPRVSYRQACSSAPLQTPVKRPPWVSDPKPTPTPPPPALPRLPATPCPKGRKSKQPLVIDVADLIKQKETNAYRRIQSAYYAPGKSNAFKENYKITTGNQLDSSGPGVIHRGKIREQKKKPSKLKLNILKSRALRKMYLEYKNKLEIASLPPPKISAVLLLSEEESLDSIEGEGVQKKESSLKKEEQDCDKTEADLTLSCDPEPGSSISIDKSENKIEPEEVEGATAVSQGYFVPNNSADELPSVISTKEEALDEKGIGEPVPTELLSSDINIFTKLFDEISIPIVKVEEIVSADIESIVKNSMHTRKFRNYCDMYTTKEFHYLVCRLLADLYRFQDRLYHSDQIKFKTKRRFVIGLKESLSYLNLNKVQLLILAPDIEQNPEPGGLDEKVNHILTLAKEHHVPYIFSGSKYTLGRPIKCVKTPVSIIAILDKQNCEDTFIRLLEEASQLRERYRNDFIAKVQALIKPDPDVV